MIKADPDNYIPLPYLSHEEFLEEVEMYTRTLADKPNLARYLLKAVEDKAPRSYIHQLLNHEPGENQNFANFYFERVQERVALWVDSQNIKLTK